MRRQFEGRGGAGWAGGGRARWQACRVLAYKFLDDLGRGLCTGAPWTPDRWVEAEQATACTAGIHACRPDDIAFWLGASLWEIELGGLIVESRHKLVASRGRLMRPMTEYPSAVRELADDGAWRSRDRAVTILTAADGSPDTWARRRRPRWLGLGGTRTEGPEELHDALTSATSLVELAALDDVEDDTYAGRAVALAADAANRAGAPMASQSPFAAAYAAGHAAGGPSGDQELFDRGYADERAHQSRWLSRRLDLVTA